MPSIPTTPPAARMRVRRVSLNRGDIAALVVGSLLTLYSLVVILMSARASHARDQAVKPAEAAAPDVPPAMR